MSSTQLFLCNMKTAYNPFLELILFLSLYFTSILYKTPDLKANALGLFTTQCHLFLAPFRNLSTPSFNLANPERPEREREVWPVYADALWEEPNLLIQASDGMQKGGGPGRAGPRPIQPIQLNWAPRPEGPRTLEIRRK